MPLYLSASSIQDYLDCSQRFFYRTTQKEQAISSDDMLVGTIVHDMIEHFWNDEPTARRNALEQAEFFNLGATKKGKIETSLDFFFTNFNGMLSPEDEIEYKFKLTLDKDIFLVGKIDRISHGNVFDWKTTTNPPKSIDTDIQFIIYTEAYRRLFGKEPIATYYASLMTGKLIKLNPSQTLTNTLFNDIIPIMSRAIKAKEFYRKGIFTNNCFNCSYKETCFEEYNYELDSKRAIK